MGAYLSKYHVAINGQGYVLAKKGGIQYYRKQRAPEFVNKFGGGDSSYRDASFWQFWVQTNWRNGSQQLKYDDPGKFWKSSDVNVNSLEEMTLSRKLTSMGQTASGVKNKVIETWRASQNWWNASYGYRKQLTITAATGSATPSGYVIRVTEDTAALQTAGKVLASRNDWRIVYWNGSAWVDVMRHYVNTTNTYFPLQAAIAAGQSDTNYYLYYGYSGETTSQQPSTEANFNTVYPMFGTTPDSSTKAIYYFREGSGTAVNDDSAGTNNGTIAGTATWAAAGQQGGVETFNGSSSRVACGAGADVQLGSMTLEGWFKISAIGAGQFLISRWEDFATNDKAAYYLQITGGGNVKFGIQRGVNIDANITTSAALIAGTWYHLAATYDGSSTAYIYIDGVQQATTSSGTWGSVNTAAGVVLEIGRNQDDGGQSYFSGDAQHIRLSNLARTAFSYTLSAANQPAVVIGSEITTQPPASTADMYVGASDGKIYKHDGATTFTEQFDCRRLVWFDTTANNDTDMLVGDQAATERAQAQSFQLAAGQTLKGLELYLKKNAGTPGDITVRIETNTAGVPSGTLADASATGTITAFTTATYSWVSINFSTSFALSASTVYWIVLKIAAGANDNNYAWGTDGSTPSYSNGNMAASADGGGTWTADTAKDALFRVKGDSTEVNCSLVSVVGGTQKMLFGVGSPSSQVNGEARIYSFDGTTWTLEKTFVTATESQVMSLAEYGTTATLYAGVGPQARVYSSTNVTTWTLSKDINVPQNPGYVFRLKEYNGVLYAAGGNPEFISTKHYNGFIYTFDGTTWSNLYPFTFTTLRSCEFYDAYLFLGTYHGHLFVYDTSSLNPIFNFKDLYNYAVIIADMKYFDDKLYIALYPQDNSNETNVGIWVYDRHGLSLAYTISGAAGYLALQNVNNDLVVATGDSGYVYKVDTANYATQGNVQMSYFDANLPSITKLFADVEVKHDPLPTGTNVKVYYKFKESDSWTLLGTSDTVAGESKVMSFASGTNSKKITLKIELNTTDTTKSPKVTEVICRYALFPTRKWQWNMRLMAKKSLQLLDKTEETLTATQIRSNLETAQSATQLITFIDVDATSYSVLFQDITQDPWVLNQDDVLEDQVSVTLIQA